MTLTVKLFCLLLALVCFGVAALGIGTGRFSLVAAGLFFVTAGEVFG